MAVVVRGEVRSLWKMEGGYEVTVDLNADGVEIKIEIPSAEDDANKAIEDARAWLVQLGIAMAKEFDNVGTLR